MSVLDYGWTITVSGDEATLVAFAADIAKGLRNDGHETYKRWWLAIDGGTYPLDQLPDFDARPIKIRGSSGPLSAAGLSKQWPTLDFHFFGCEACEVYPRYFELNVRNGQQTVVQCGNVWIWNDLDDGGKQHIWTRDIVKHDPESNTWKIDAADPLNDRPWRYATFEVAKKCVEDRADDRWQQHHNSLYQAAEQYFDKKRKEEVPNENL